MSELQFSNKPELILVIACGNVADVRLAQPENALAPRYVTFYGTEIEESALQFWNAPPSINVMLSGSVICFNAVQFWNAP